VVGFGGDAVFFYISVFASVMKRWIHHFLKKKCASATVPSFASMAIYLLALVGLPWALLSNAQSTSTVSAPLASNTPTCPASNNTIYNTGSGAQYYIECE
jgi:predicted PurR-regulated permease PerM